MRLSNLTLGTVLLALVPGCAPGDPSSPTAFEGAAELGCGQCVFDQPGHGCDLAVRIGADVHFCTGAGIDDFGDAHAEDGLCHTARSASIRGRLDADGSFAIDSAELLD